VTSFALETRIGDQEVIEFREILEGQGIVEVTEEQIASAF
jgi:hypothetical protein